MTRIDDTDQQLISTRPYLIRAIRDWALDNELTPQLLVDASFSGVEVPPGYAKDGKIVLNVHPRAVETIELGNEIIALSARFGGIPFEVMLPVRSVLAIFTRENDHQGIFFQSSQSSDESNESTEQTQDASVKESSGSIRRPHLRLVE
jgi:stringent starvation protein B